MPDGIADFLELPNCFASLRLQAAAH